MGSRAHVQVSRENVADDRLGVAQRLGKLVRANVAAGERETGNRRPANFGPGSQPGTARGRGQRGSDLEHCPRAEANLLFSKEGDDRRSGAGTIDRLIRIRLELIGGSALLHPQAEQAGPSHPRLLYLREKAEIAAVIAQLDRPNLGIPRRAGRSLGTPALEPEIGFGKCPLPFGPEGAARPSEQIATYRRLARRRGGIDRILVRVAEETEPPAERRHLQLGEPIMSTGTQISGVVRCYQGRESRTHTQQEANPRLAKGTVHRDPRLGSRGAPASFESGTGRPGPSGDGPGKSRGIIG